MAHKRPVWNRDCVFGPETVEVTVWFDPAAGLILRSESSRTTTSESRDDNGQILTSNLATEIVVQLVSEN